jgi:hypothetical protein
MLVPACCQERQQGVAPRPAAGTLLTPGPERAAGRTCWWSKGQGSVATCQHEVDKRANTRLNTLLGTCHLTTQSPRTPAPHTHSLLYMQAALRQHASTHVASMQGTCTSRFNLATIHTLQGTCTSRLLTTTHTPLGQGVHSGKQPAGACALHAG